MTKEAIIRAWKDDEYRSSLSDAERSMLPDNPAGLVEISDRHLDHVDGAATGAVCSVVTIVLLTALSRCFSIV